MMSPPAERSQRERQAGVPRIGGNPVLVQAFLDGPDGQGLGPTPRGVATRTSRGRTNRSFGSGGAARDSTGKFVRSSVCPGSRMLWLTVGWRIRHSSSVRIGNGLGPTPRGVATRKSRGRTNGCFGSGGAARLNRKTRPFVRSSARWNRLSLWATCVTTAGFRPSKPPRRRCDGSFQSSVFSQRKRPHAMRMAGPPRFPN